MSHAPNNPRVAGVLALSKFRAHVARWLWRMVGRLEAHNRKRHLKCALRSLCESSLWLREFGMTVEAQQTDAMADKVAMRLAREIFSSPNIVHEPHREDGRE